MSRYYTERNNRIYEMFISGYTISQIAREAGLSNMRISQIIADYVGRNRIKVTDNKPIDIFSEYYLNKITEKCRETNCKSCIFLVKNDSFYDSNADISDQPWICQFKLIGKELSKGPRKWDSELLAELLKEDRHYASVNSDDISDENESPSPIEGLEDDLV